MSGSCLLGQDPSAVPQDDSIVAYKRIVKCHSERSEESYSVL